MSIHAKLTNPYAAIQQVIGVAVQSNKVYLPPSGFGTFVGSAAPQIYAIR
jgi:hypothetical protein